MSTNQSPPPETDAQAATLKANDAASAAGAPSVEVPPKKSKKWLVMILVALVALPGLGAAGYMVFKILTTEKIKTSLLDYADSNFDVKDGAEEKDLFKVIEKPQYFYQIPEKNYLLIPAHGITYVRIKFVIETKQSKDLDIVEANEPLIVETLNSFMLKVSADDFEGMVKKQARRDDIVKVLQEKVSDRIVNIHYAAIRFQ